MDHGESESEKRKAAKKSTALARRIRASGTSSSCMDRAGRLHPTQQHPPRRSIAPKPSRPSRKSKANPPCCAPCPAAASDSYPDDTADRVRKSPLCASLCARHVPALAAWRTVTTGPHAATPVRPSNLAGAAISCFAGHTCLAAYRRPYAGPAKDSHGSQQQRLAVVSLASARRGPAARQSWRATAQRGHAHMGEGWSRNRGHPCYRAMR